MSDPIHQYDVATIDLSHVESNPNATIVTFNPNSQAAKSKSTTDHYHSQHAQADNHKTFGKKAHGQTAKPAKAKNTTRLVGTTATHMECVQADHVFNEIVQFEKSAKTEAKNVLLKTMSHVERMNSSSDNMFTMANFDMDVVVDDDSRKLNDLLNDLIELSHEQERLEKQAYEQPVSCNGTETSFLDAFLNLNDSELLSFAPLSPVQSFYSTDAMLFY
jgi:hypothetical protein